MTKWKAAGLAAVILGALSCAGSTENLKTSAKIPAAEGTVKTSSTKNNNTKLDVEVKHLAPPERVQEGASVYTAWVVPTMNPAESRPHNIGAILVGDNLAGKLSTEVPWSSFDFFITAEPAPGTQSPSGQQLMWTRVQK